MTIPTLSIPPIIGVILAPDNMPKRPLVDYELGGVALQDISQGLRVQQWRAWFDRARGAVFVEAPLVLETKIFEQVDIEWLSFCFDQNMRWTACYTLSRGVSYLRWYDSKVADYVITELQTGVITPFLALDDKRPLQSTASDMLLTYLRKQPPPSTKQNLYLRGQRERFATEHLLHKDVPADWTIRNFGMSRKLRMQWEIR